MPPEPYSIPGFTDPVSALTHLGGAVAFTALAPFLLARGRGNAGRVWCLGVFASTTVLLLLASGVYHLWPRETPFRETLLRLDHGAIFLLIAGTATPVHGILFRGTWRWAPLVFAWGVALLGVMLTTVYPDLVASWMRFALYLGLGWMGAFTGIELWRRHGPRFIGPLLWGGVAYTAGAALEMLAWPVLIPRVVRPHELFHVFVLVGAAFHWRFVFSFACGTIPPSRLAAARLTGNGDANGSVRVGPTRLP